MATCAFAMITKDGSVLLVQIAPPFREDHKWNFPGGVIEDGEEIESGLAREILEETNLNCDILQKIDTFNTKDPDNEINIFLAKYLSGDIKLQLKEILSAKWFTFDEALKLPLAFNIIQYLKSLTKPRVS